MPLADQLIVLVICVAFVSFGVILAWGDFRTRNMPPQ